LNPGGVTENEALAIYFVGAFFLLRENPHNMLLLERNEG